MAMASLTNLRSETETEAVKLIQMLQENQEIWKGGDPSKVQRFEAGD
jgi:hypothetical protein